MKTFEQQTLPFGGDVSTSSRVDSPANRSALQENASEHPTNATCGPKCCELFARFAPDGSWARTFADLLIGRKDWSSKRCALTWKLSATKYNRLYFRLVASTLPTGATACGLLPTVQTQGLKVCENGQSVPMDARLLPTPRASDSNTGTAAQASDLKVDARMRLRSLNHYMSRRVGKNSQLNPLFVAEMMGFPTDWTVYPFLHGAESPSKPTATR